ncbi:ABC transporter ATP-binding protein [bacterium]|nr:ABC transporter ATP-binding protein [candidate division CSSED10-310 bacterium]
MSNTAVSLSNVSKTYSVPSKQRLLSTTAFKFFFKANEFRKITALEKISLDVKAGEVLGIVGPNGAGKSTLLKVLSGVTQPDSGTISIKGRLTSLLELGVGFAPDLSGIENIRLYGSLMGISRQKISEKISLIIEFSGLGNYINEPVRTYSSGMFIRLAFAVAVFADPDILVLDEVLGVGDLDYQYKCFNHIFQKIKQGVTVIIVSHDMSVIGNVCSRVICLDNGRITYHGTAEEVVKYYTEILSNTSDAHKLENSNVKIVFNKGALQVSCHNLPLTAPDGFRTLYKKSELFYLSSEAIWQKLKSTDSELVMEGQWLQWNLIQIWEFRFLNENSFEWIIKTTSGSQNSADHLEIQMIVSSSFNLLTTSHENRKLPPINPLNMYLEPMLMRPFLRDFIGFQTTETESSKMGMIIDLTGCRNAGGTCQVLNGNTFVRGRIVSRKITDPVTDYLRIKIQLLSQESFHVYVKEHEQIAHIGNEDFKVLFTDSAFHLISEGKYLTAEKGLSLTSVPASGTMECESMVNPDNMVIRCTSEVLPVVYIWTVEIVGHQCNWRLDMECLGTVVDYSVIVSCTLSKSLPKGKSLKFSDRCRKLEDGYTFLMPSSAEKSADLSPGKRVIAEGKIWLRVM